eukprot:COSAG06_NODE_63529_length_262_cov_0.625767_1_plen_79_part_10
MRSKAEAARPDLQTAVAGGLKRRGPISGLPDRQRSVVNLKMHKLMPDATVSSPRSEQNGYSYHLRESEYAAMQRAEPPG